jgi:hypothetical protein
MRTLTLRPTHQKMLASVFLNDILCCVVLFLNVLSSASTPVEMLSGMFSYGLAVIAVVFMQLSSSILNLVASYFHFAYDPTPSIKVPAAMSLITLIIASLLILLHGELDLVSDTEWQKQVVKLFLTVTLLVSHITFMVSLTPGIIRGLFNRIWLVHFILFLAVSLVGIAFLFDALPNNKAIRASGLTLVAFWRFTTLRIMLWPDKAAPAVYN